MQEASVARQFCASRHRLFIDGEWVEARSGETIAVVDPSTGDWIGEAPAGGPDDVNMAVQAARRFMREGQARFAPQERTRLIWKLADAIEAQAGELAEIESLNVGKPIRNARAIDIPGAVAALRYFAGWATKLEGETLSASGGGAFDTFTLREPVGVVGQIVPWNYPLMGMVIKLAQALAAGCAVVVKPSELTPLSAIRLGQLIQEVGFPPGVINIVTGLGPVAGAALVDHPDVQKISFTGSTATGREIVRGSAGTMKRVTVELGGKSPVIVLPDADLDAAAASIAQGIFINSGQTCSAGSRVLAHESIAARLVEKVCEAAAGLKVGPGLDASTEIGPLVSPAHRDRVLAFIERGKAEGATVAVGGSAIRGPGCFVQPTVLTNTSRGMSVVDNEIFGPVLCVSSFAETDPAAIAEEANAGEYGLAAYVWTRSLHSAHALTRALKSGLVKVNAGGGGDFALPVGGVKQSGFGRENGRLGVEAYTEIKSVLVAY